MCNQVLQVALTSSGRFAGLTQGPPLFSGSKQLRAGATGWDLSSTCKQGILRRSRCMRQHEAAGPRVPSFQTFFPVQVSFNPSYLCPSMWTRIACSSLQIESDMQTGRKLAIYPGNNARWSQDLKLTLDLDIDCRRAPCTVGSVSLPIFQKGSLPARRRSEAIICFRSCCYLQGHPEDVGDVACRTVFDTLLVWQTQTTVTYQLADASSCPAQPALLLQALGTKRQSYACNRRGRAAFFATQGASQEALWVRLCAWPGPGPFGIFFGLGLTVGEALQLCWRL